MLSTATATGATVTENSAHEDSYTGMAIGLGIVAAVSALVITVLTIKLFKKR